MIDKLDSYGQLTYRGAWALEIIAASMGLLTALLLGSQAYQESDSAIPLDAILMAIPFVMVAFAELTKIPIATLLFVAPIIYKPFALIALVLLAAITFETVVGGLDTALSQRQEKFRNIESKITEVVSKIDALRSDTNVEASSSTLDTIQKQISSLEVARSDEIKRFESQINEVRNSSIPIESQTQINLYNAEIKRIDETLNRLKITIETNEAKDQSKFQDQQLSYTNQIKVYIDSGDKYAARQIQFKLDQLPNPANKSPWKKRRRAYDKEVSKLDDDKSEYLSKRDEIFSNLTVSPEVTAEIDRLQNQREKTLSNMSEQIQRLYTKKAEFAQNQFDKLDMQSQNLRQADVLEQQLIQLNSQRASIANKNQIRRFAATWYQVSAVDVTDKQEQSATKVYVSSLAGLAALAGPLTAIVALALQAIAAKERLKISNANKRSLKQRFWISLRRYFIKSKHKRRKTVVKEVEVEVEKIVIKEVEVEVEVEKAVEKIVEVPVVEKELLYIPILTDDPEKMMEDLEKKLPKEAFSQIKVGISSD
jgi:hypothetical protein